MVDDNGKEGTLEEVVDAVLRVVLLLVVVGDDAKKALEEFLVPFTLLLPDALSSYSSFFMDANAVALPVDTNVDDRGCVIEVEVKVEELFFFAVIVAGLFALLVVLLSLTLLLVIVFRLLSLNVLLVSML